MNPLVSIIVPTYEQEDLAVEAARSALRQDYPELEVVVVDDASPTARHAELCAIDDPRLRFIRRPANVGRTENYRQSLRDFAHGEWVMVLDGDDYLTDANFVSCAMSAAAKDPEIVMVAARSQTHSSHGTFVSTHPGTVTLHGLEVLKALPNMHYFLQHLAVIYRRADALALDFYRSPTISSDWESLYRLASRGRIAFIDRVVGVWRIHDSNASGVRESRAMIDNLDIWEPIYAEATAQGLSEEVARQRCILVKRFMARQHIPKVARSWRDLLGYLCLLRERHPSALAGLVEIKTLMQLALALTGYYRKR